MKLYFSPTSPYVRKVRVFALATGLDARIERVDVELSPVKPSATLNRDNPLGKVPALVTDDGEALYDSRVICEYLDTLHEGARLVPEQGPARWRALRRQALADGLLDAAVAARYETALRPERLRWPEWEEGQLGKVRRAVDALEQEIDALSGVDIAAIAAGCALGYLDFRYPGERWRDGHPRLAQWFEHFAGRASMQATAPPG